jgi:hypothetical protein
MARLFDAPLRVMTVVPTSEKTEGEVLQDEGAAREEVQALLAEHDHEGLELSVVVVSGVPAERIVDAADDAGLLVVGSRGFDPLIPDWLGPVTSRTLRYSHCSALTIREVDGDLKRRERAISSLADAHRDAWQLMDDGHAVEALPLIESAAERAPANATIQETFAVALEKVGRHVEARGRREIAKMIRKHIDSHEPFAS